MTHLSVATDRMKVLNTDTHTQIHIKIHKHLVTQAAHCLCACKCELYLTFSCHDYSVCRSVLPLRTHNLHFHLFSQNYSPETGTRPFWSSSKSLITKLHKHCSNFEHWKKNKWEKIKERWCFSWAAVWRSCGVFIALPCTDSTTQFLSQSTDSTIRNPSTSNVKCISVHWEQ